MVDIDRLKGLNDNVQNNGFKTIRDISTRQYTHIYMYIF